MKSNQHHLFFPDFKTKGEISLSPLADELDIWVKEHTNRSSLTSHLCFSCVCGTFAPPAVIFEDKFMQIYFSFEPSYNLTHALLNSLFLPTVLWSLHKQYRDSELDQFSLLHVAAGA